MEAQVSRRQLYETPGTNGVLGRVFLHHPHSLGESYWEHQRQALEFGSLMVMAGVACLIHALVPALFVKTGSTMISNLHDRLIRTRRIAARAPLRQ